MLEIRSGRFCMSPSMMVPRLSRVSSGRSRPLVFCSAGGAIGNIKPQGTGASPAPAYRRGGERLKKRPPITVLYGSAPMSDDRHTITSGGLSATVLAHGAELCSLKTADGLELVWQAGPEWRRHAPLLFPIVGRLKNDQLHHGGKSYPMTQHG